MKSPYNNSIQTLVVSIKEENSDEIDYTLFEAGFQHSTYFEITVFEIKYWLYRILRVRYKFFILLIKIYIWDN